VSVITDSQLITGYIFLIHIG